MNTKTMTKNQIDKNSTSSTANNINNKIAVFASGSGSNAQKIIEHFVDSAIARVTLIVCNTPTAGVIQRAEAFKIPVLLIDKEQFLKGDGFVPKLRDHQISFIVLAGFLWKIPLTLIEAFPNRIINIHPALLPKYGGKGMYGMKVHSAVIEAGETESGITIHYVDEHYDNGDIIFQATCPVYRDDTPDALASRIHELEHNDFPGVIEKILSE